MEDRFAAIARKVSDIAGSPIALLSALALIVVWGLLGPLMKFSAEWQLLINTPTTIITFLMVFLVQNAQNTDTKALHAKIDGLIRAIPEADDRLSAIEQRTKNEIEELKEDCGD